MPGLSDFRQNSQGSIGQLNIADLTVELTDLGNLCLHRAGQIDLQAEVCNRGTNPVQDGMVVQFLETTDPNQPIKDAKVVCETTTTKLLLPGQCEIFPVMPAASVRLPMESDPGVWKCATAEDKDCFKFGGHTSGNVPEVMVIDAPVAQAVVTEIP